MNSKNDFGVKIVFIVVTLLLASSLAISQSYEDSEESKVDVSVDYNCDVRFREFSGPTDGVMAVKEIGFFDWRFENEGSVDANVSAVFNVTFEGNSSWQPGEPIGTANYSQPLKNSTIPENGSLSLTNDSYYDESLPNNWSYSNDTFQDTFYSNKSAGEGWYTGRTNFTAKCPHVYKNEDNETVKDWSNATVLKYSDFTNFVVLNSSGGISDSGNQSTNSTIPDEPDELNDTEADEPVPSDANETGGNGTQVEGDNQQPGVTPEPEPEPEPEPIPQLSMDIESVERQYNGPPGEFIPANLTVTNEGNTVLNSLTVTPIVDNREGWQASEAQIASLQTNQTVYREVLVQTAENTDDGIYTVPVRGSNPENELDVDYFTLNISRNLSAIAGSRLSIQEAPRNVNTEVNTSQSLPVLLENTGEANLTNISGRLQNVGECGDVEISDVERLAPSETASLGMDFESGMSSQQCNTTLIVSSSEGSYAFTNINFTISPEEGLIPQRYQVPGLAVGWTILLALFAVLKKRYEDRSSLIKIPFVLLVAGEVLIFVYLLVDYYQLVSASFLPF